MDCHEHPHFLNFLNQIFSFLKIIYLDLKDISWDSSEGLKIFFNNNNTVIIPTDNLNRFFKFWSREYHRVWQRELESFIDSWRN